jgi:hypothetical protein
MNQANKILRVLVLGAKPEFERKGNAFECSRSDGHILFFARSISEAWSILQKESIDRIAIEAFMETDRGETPFDFLPLLKASRHSNIPVLIVAAEPSSVGILLSESVERATIFYGAQFLIMEKFNAEEVRMAVEAASLG